MEIIAYRIYGKLLFKFFRPALGCILLIALSLSIKAQRINDYHSLYHIDYPYNYHRNMVKTGFHTAKTYICADSIFDKKKCTCTVQQTFGKEGNITSTLMGNDLDDNQINYSIKYGPIKNRQCEVQTKYMSHFVDSISLFKYDSVIRHKRKLVDIYPREKNGDLFVRSVLFFSDTTDMPDSAFRYGRDGKLAEIYFPKGRDWILKTWSACTNDAGRKTWWTYNMYPNYEYHTYTIESDSGRVVETGNFLLRSHNMKSEIEKVFYFYNDSFNLIRKIAVDGDQKYIHEEIFEYYKNNQLKQYSKTSGTNDMVIEKKLYDDEGKLVESIDYNSKKQFRYESELVSQILFFFSGKYRSSTFFIYE